MRETLRNLTYSDNSEWFGVGPLTLAVVAGVRAFLADDTFARWAWISVAVVMLVLCAVFVVAVRRRRS